MKLNYSKRTFSTYLLSFFVLVLSSSCIVYQNVPEDDGIYSDNDVTFSTEKKKTRVIAENSDEHRDYEKNYFTKELERLEEIENSDILTDIDSYSTVNDSISDVEINYTPQAWGYGEDDDIVININLDNGYRWGGGYWDYCWPYYDYGFNSFWFGQRHYWGWFYNRPFYRPWGWGWGGYWRGGPGAYAYYRFRAQSGYPYYNYRNMRYGRRGGTYSSRIAANTNSIYSRSRRASTNSRRVSSVYRRGTQTTRGKNSSTTTPTRTRSRFTRGNSSNSRTRGNTNTRSRNSSSTSRSRFNRSSSRSRSSSTRSSSRGSSRSSSARSSSRKRG